MKYAFLHFSYSAPVRVSVVARATTFVARGADDVAVRDVVPRVAVVDCVVAVLMRFVFVCVGVDVRTRWVAVPARVNPELLAGVTDVRDAAKPPVATKAQKTKIIPILLISDFYVSKFHFSGASK